MPLTKPRPTLTVTFRRADIQAFWIVSTGVLALVLGLAARIFGVQSPWAWSVAALGLPLPGLIWPMWFELGIRAWNKLVLVCTVALRAYVLKVGYYLLFAAVGRTGSSLDLVLRKDEVSRWIPRARHELAFGNRHQQGTGEGWWGRELLTSARNPGNGWQVCLLPVVLLLMVLREEGQESALPSSTYTLY